MIPLNFSHFADSGNVNISAVSLILAEIMMIEVIINLFSLPRQLNKTKSRTQQQIFFMRVRETPGGQSQPPRGLQVKLTGQIKAYILYLTDKRKAICNKHVICMSMNILPGLF